MTLEKDIDLQVAKDFLDDFLFDYLNKDEYIRIILFSGRGIDGFSRQNIHKVPKMMLKNHAKRRIRNIRDAREVLQFLVIDQASQFDQLSLEQFISQVELSEKVSLGQKLTLLFLNYQDIFQGKFSQIKENLLADRPPFQNIVSLSTSDTMQALFSSKRKKLMETIQQLLSFEGLTSKGLTNQEDMTLQARLNRQDIPPVATGEYLKLYVDNYDELKDLDPELLEDFLNLVFTDTVLLYEKHRHQLKNDLNELELQRSEDLEHFQKENNELTSENSRLTDELNQLNRKLQEIEQNHTNLSNKYEELQQLYEEQLQTEERLSEKATSLADQLVGAEIKLLEAEKIYFVTQVEDASFKFYFTDEQIIYYRSASDLANQLRACDPEAIYFINFDNVATRDSFQIESCFIERNLLYRMVSNGTKNIIRTIVYYLEGELRYAIKTEA